MLSFSAFAILLLPSFADSIPWWDGIPIGSHSVGLETFAIARNSAAGTRRIQVAVWYPARAATVAAARFEALWRLARVEEPDTGATGATLEQALALHATGDMAGFSTGDARRALAAPLLARLGVPAAQGSSPIVVWGSRHSTGAAQAPLSEVLASHGYVVIAAWSTDPPLAFIWEDHPPALKLATIAAQTDDLRAAIDATTRRLAPDTMRIGLLAWSYGGQTAARLQETLAGARVVVSLDANVLPARGEERLTLRVPLVAFFPADTTHRGLERLDSVTAPMLALRFPLMAHGNFNALEGYLPGLLGATTVHPWTRGGSDAVTGYRAVARLTLAALQRFLAPEPAPPRALLQELLDQSRAESATGSLRGAR